VKVVGTRPLGARVGRYLPVLDGLLAVKRNGFHQNSKEPSQPSFVHRGQVREERRRRREEEEEEEEEEESHSP